MPLRRVGVVGALCLLTGWLMASLVLPPVASLQSSPVVDPPATPAARAAQAPAYAERLRLKLREAPAAPTSRRNPFAFEQPRPPAAPRSALRAGPPAAPTFEVHVPPFELAGIATTESADGALRTAVLSTSGDVVLARVGDVLADGSRVVGIDETSVTLDVAGRPLVLRLK